MNDLNTQGKSQKQLSSPSIKTYFLISIKEMTQENMGFM